MIVAQRVALAAQLTNERDAVLAAITGAGDPQQATQAATEAQRRERDRWHQVIGAIITAAFWAGGTYLVQALRDAVSPGTLTAATSDTGTLADAWGDGVTDHLGTMLSAVLALGLPGDALTTAVDGLYAQWAGETGQGDYATQVTGDMVVTGWGQGQQETMASLLAQGTYQAEKTWNTMGDDRVRTSHMDVDGMTVDASDSFNVGGEDLDYPGSPNGSLAETSGCRCWLTWAAVNNITGETQDSSAPSGEE